MYILKVTDGETVLTFKSETRANVRGAYLLAKENGFEAEVTKETKPQPVKFKGVD